jgi:hypothetical protein
MANDDPLSERATPEHRKMLVDRELQLDAIGLSTAVVPKLTGGNDLPG